MQKVGKFQIIHKAIVCRKRFTAQSQEAFELKVIYQLTSRALGNEATFVALIQPCQDHQSTKSHLVILSKIEKKWAFLSFFFSHIQRSNWPRREINKNFRIPSSTLQTFDLTND